MKEYEREFSKTLSGEEEENESESTSSQVLLRKDILGSALELISQVYKNVPDSFHIRGKVVKYTSDRDECSISNEDQDRSRCLIIDKEPKSFKADISDIPTDVCLHIFSYLDVFSLCKVSAVNRTWYNISNDNLLWETKLTCDMYKWEVIDHLSHPKLHKETNSELTPKNIYLQCCPECRNVRRQMVRFPAHMPKLSYFFGFSVPRIVMFGSGMDSSGLVKRVLWDQTSPFEVKGMFPGQFEGMGSGVTLQYSGGSLNLICLYALSRAERENQDINGERKSRLLVGEQQEISQSVKELCSSVDAFIYIVDGTSEEAVQFGCEELKAVIDDRWLQPKIPVLVLCLVQNATIKSVSSLQVANQLELLQLNRPWQVRQCHVNSLYGYVPGVNWLNKHIIGL